MSQWNNRASVASQELRKEDCKVKSVLIDLMSGQVDRRPNHCGQKPEAKASRNSQVEAEMAARS